MKICSVEGCHNSHYAKGFCNKHWSQMRLHGKILKRTRFDPNEVFIKGDICRVKLYNMKNEVIAETIIDSEDWPKVKGKKWCLSRHYVVTKKVKGESAYLHHHILGEPASGQEVDHINGNKLDNRKLNLRFCSRTQNCHNTKRHCNNRSGYKGVFKQRSKWAAQIKIPNEKNIHIGTFETPELAAKAYNEKAKLIQGKFARLNII